MKKKCGSGERRTEDEKMMGDSEGLISLEKDIINALQDRGPYVFCKSGSGSSGERWKDAGKVRKGRRITHIPLSTPHLELDWKSTEVDSMSTCVLGKEDSGYPNDHHQQNQHPSNIHPPNSSKHPKKTHLPNLTSAPLQSLQSLQSQEQQKKSTKIISIKQLFSAPPKFQKQCKRGIFLTCVIYSEDKLLVTSEEHLPTLEIDDAIPISLHNDFHWLHKVSATWENVKSFKTELEKCGSASAFHFRLKLLQGCLAMQTALGITDLGRLYYKTTMNEDNSVAVISTVNYLRSTKRISSLSVRWIPFAKMCNRKSTKNVLDILTKSIQDQIFFHQVSNMPVGRGLYLGYLMLASTVDVLKILVAGKYPNMIPHTKLRDDPHISIEEWAIIRSLFLTCTARDEQRQDAERPVLSEGAQTANGSPSCCKIVGTKGENVNREPPTNKYSTQLNNIGSEKLLRGQIITGLKRLFSHLEIDDESSLHHRLYHGVIEVSSSVSLLIVVPPVEKMCVSAGAGIPDKLLQRKDLIMLPVQIFEVLNMSAYRSEFISRFSRVSAVLEISTVVAEHNQREAFSTGEIAAAKKHLSRLQDLQKRLDSAWEGARWVKDVVTVSRDRSAVLVSVKSLLDGAIDLRSIASPTRCLERPRAAENHSDAPSMISHLQKGASSPISCVENTAIFNTSCPPPSLWSSSNLTFSRPQICNSDVERLLDVCPSQFMDQTTFLFKPGFPSVQCSQSQSDVSHFILTESQAASRILSSSLHNLHSKGSTSRGENQLQTDFVQAGGSIISGNSTTLPEYVSPRNEGDSYRRFEYHPPLAPRRPGISTKDMTDIVCQNGLPASMDFSVSSKSCSVSSSTLHCPETSAIFRIPSLTSAPQLTNLPSLYLSTAQESLLSRPLTVIQVYAAYNCGLSEGTSVRIQINNQTTARQVVDLLVKQLNTKVVAKGLQSPVYEQTQDFCLVSVIGARERCLRNDFNPLLLQNPWKSGCMYVRRRNDVTAAIEMNSRDYRS